MCHADKHKLGDEPKWYSEGNPPHARLFFLLLGGQHVFSPFLMVGNIFYVGTMRDNCLPWVAKALVLHATA